MAHDCFQWTWFDSNMHYSCEPWKEVVIEFTYKKRILLPVEFNGNDNTIVLPVWESQYWLISKVGLLIKVVFGVHEFVGAKTILHVVRHGPVDKMGHESGRKQKRDAVSETPFVLHDEEMFMYCSECSNCWPVGEAAHERNRILFVMTLAGCGLTMNIQLGGGFNFLDVHPYLGKWSIWLIFFRWVETTNKTT